MTNMRTRREPPKFRRVEVGEVERLGPRLVRVALTGPELDGFEVDLPAASVRLLLPSPGTTDLVMPAWNGNEFLLPDGRRPTIRTFTPMRTPQGLDLWIVDHGTGAASTWAANAKPGDPAAVSGPGRGYVIDPDAPAFLLAGDETAAAAIAQLRDAIPDHTPVDVHITDDLLDAVRNADIAPDTRVWVAGEAAEVQAVRRHLFDERGVPRSHTSVRGYWKRGRSGDAGDVGDAASDPPE